MRRALGKGLSQLIAEQYDGSPLEATVDSIVPNPRQPRSTFHDESLSELAASIKEYGILQPLVVRPLAEGRYELIAGERRLRAAKLAGLPTVPVTVRSAGQKNSLELALIENIQREDINALECARAYRRLIDEFGMTQEQVAERVGKSRVAITNTVRLLKLPQRIQSGLEQGRITEGHARALLGFETEAQQLAVYDQILERGLTVREVERTAKPRPEASAVSRTPKAETPRDPNWEALEEALSIYLGSQVRLQKSEVGGKIVVDFYSDDDLERILNVLGITL